MFTLKQSLATIALLCLSGSSLLAQTSVQNFGTDTGSFITANGNSTTFLPNPTGSGSTYVAINNGGGAINLVNPGLSVLGNASEVRASASSNANVNKFTPILSYTNGTSYYTTFWLVLGNSSGGNTATSGEWAFYQGAGTGYNSTGDMATSQVHAGLRFTYGTGGSITFNYLSGSSWTALASSNIYQGNLYKIEIMGNNGTGTINYNYGNGSNSVAANRFDLWIDGVLVGNDLNKGAIANNTNVNAITFIGKNSTSNVANIFVDDMTVYNSIPANITANCSTPTVAASNLAFSGHTNSTITLNWTSGNGSNRIIICKQGSAVTSNPVDNTSYTANTAFGSGTEIATGEFVVYNGSGNSITITALPSGYHYFFKIIEYNCSNGNEKYYNSGALSDESYTRPGNVSGFQVDCNTSGDISLSWTNPASGFDNILIFARAGSPSFNPAGAQGNTYNANSNFTLAQIYSTDKCVYNGSGSNVNITGLISGTQYQFRIVAYTGDLYSNLVGPIVGVSGVANVSGFTLTPGNGIINASWTNPTLCYDEILIVAVATNNVSAIPSGNGSAYDADAFFGTDISNSGLPVNEYAVYKGNGTNFTIYGLINSINYKVKVFVRHGSNWSSGIQSNATPANVAGDFRTIQSGNWTDISTWQRFNGTNWVTPGAGQFPNQQTASVTIRDGHTVTVNGPGGNYQVATLIVESNAKLFVNSTTTQRYLNIYTQVNNNGIIGNGATIDGIAFNIEGANVYLGGSGQYKLSRVRKDYNSTAITNCSISANVDFNCIGSAKTVMYNNQGNTTFNVTINSGAIVSTPSTFGNVSIDGVSGGSGGNRRGSITVHGTLNVNGILYATCKNGAGAGSSPNRITIENGGVINVDSIDASSSNAAGHIFTIKNNGWLNIYGAAFFTFSTSNNTYDCQSGSLVEYSGISAQTVEAGITYANLKYSGGENNKTQNNNLTVNEDLTVSAAIYNSGVISRTLTLGGNFTLVNNGSMSNNCRSYLNIICNNTNNQLFSGNGQMFNCYDFNSVKTSGNITFSTSSNLYCLNDFDLNYTGTSVFSDGGNTIFVGDDAELGSAASTASNFNFTGTLVFNHFGSPNGDRHISNYAGTGISTAYLNHLKLSGVTGSTTPSVLIYPLAGSATNFLNIKGDIFIENVNSINSVLVTNNNSINIGGNWTTYNQSGFTEGTGRVVFNGSTNQVISGAETFYQMEINNPTSVTLNNTVIISNALRLNNGVIITDSSEVHVTNNATTAVVLHNNNSYVRGNLRRNVSSTGTYDFPVGDANYQLASVKLNSSSGIGNILAFFNSGLPGTMPNPTICKVNGSGISNMLNSGYWTITPNAMSSVNYDVTLYARGYNNFSGGATQLCVIKRNNSSSPWMGTNGSGVNGYHNAADQSLSGGAAISKRNGVTGFSDFGVGFGAVPLPVQMSSFEVAANQNNSASIYWSTASELNCDFFEVLHSRDGIDFSVIGTVKGAGTSEMANDYSFIHSNPICGINYYRLRQVDFDGKYEFSEIKYMNIRCSIDISIYPNPASNTIFINTDTIDEHSNVRVTDINGRIVLVTKYMQSGINISTLPAGIYILEVQNENIINQTRFIKSN